MEKALGTQQEYNDLVRKSLIASGVLQTPPQPTGAPPVDNQVLNALTTIMSRLDVMQGTMQSMQDDIKHLQKKNDRGSSSP